MAQAIGKGECRMSVNAWVDGHTRVEFVDSRGDDGHIVRWVKIGWEPYSVTLFVDADGANRLIAALSVLRDECREEETVGGLGTAS